MTKLNLHESKSEILPDYTGDFVLNGSMVIGPVEHETIIRFRNMAVFDSYINAIDIDYISDDIIFTGHVYKLNKPQFNVDKRSAYAESANYMTKIVEYQ